MARLLKFLGQKSQYLPATVAFEARGRKEDGELSLSFANIMEELQCVDRFRIKILPKTSNCCGLQLADLVARPIGRQVLKPDQPNRAYEIVRGKLFANDGEVEDYGLKIFP
jgi:hypothetical protein